jgi:hypothetical protein
MIASKTNISFTIIVHSGEDMRRNLISLLLRFLREFFKKNFLFFPANKLPYLVFPFLGLIEVTVDCLN